MLNYNKIKSDISKRKIDLTEIATFGKLKYSSFRDRYMEKRLYANEIDFISQFFERSIDYYFDREEKQGNGYKNNDALNFANESCPSCEKMKAEIDRLNDKLNDKQDIINALKDANAALKGEHKKENSLASDQKAG